MVRYLKLIFIYFGINIKELKSYGIDFYLGSFAMFLKNLSNLFIIYAIYNIVNVINGWDIYEMTYLYALVTISFSVWRCFFINTLNISNYIVSGKLDLLLSKPLNPLFLIFMEGFDEDAWGDLALGLVMYFYTSYILKIKLISVFLILLISLSGGLVFAGISVLGSLISILYLGVNNFSDLPYMIYEFSKYPLSIFNTVISFVFKTIFPIAWISYIPALTVLKEKNNIFLIFIVSIGLSIIYFVAIYKLWNYFLKKYSSSGT